MRQEVPARLAGTTQIIALHLAPQVDTGDMLALLLSCRHVYNLLGLGSVSYYTMLRVPCPVVVVKGDET